MPDVKGTIGVLGFKFLLRLGLNLTAFESNYCAFLAMFPPKSKRLAVSTFYTKDIGTVHSDHIFCQKKS